MPAAQASCLDTCAAACYRADTLDTVLYAQASRYSIGVTACFRAESTRTRVAQCSRIGVTAYGQLTPLGLCGSIGDLPATSNQHIRGKASVSDSEATIFEHLEPGTNTAIRHLQ